LSQISFTIDSHSKWRNRADGCYPSRALAACTCAAPGQGQGHRRPVFTNRQPITCCFTSL